MKRLREVVGKKQARKETREITGGATSSANVLPKNDGQKLKREKNPFEIAPNSYKQETFELCHPFMSVQFSSRVDRRGLPDKVQDEKKMDDNALWAVADVVTTDFIHSSMCTKSRTTELGSRDLYTSLIKGFWRLTKPHIKPLLFPNGRIQMTKDEKLKNTSLKKIEDDELEGLILEEDVDTEEEANEENRPSTESLDGQCEGNIGEIAESEKNVRFGICCRVFDQKVVGDDKSVAVLLIDSKRGTMTLENMFQVAAYGMDEIKSNIAKGRYEPIYLEIWDEALWRYAILYAMGIVHVEGGKARSTSRTSTPLDVLQGKFDERKAQLSYKYPDSQYPDGEYIEGIFFLCQDGFVLPRTERRGGGETEDASIFFQSTLRILVGDHVLGWSEEDVYNAGKIRDRQTIEKKKNFLPRKRICCE